MITAILAAGAVLAAAGSVADGAVTLELGQGAVVTLGPDGAVPADPGLLSEKNLQFSGEVVRFHLSSQAGMVVLMVNNGYGQMVDYDAEIYAGNGRHMHTSTCPVIANITGMESWGDPIVKIRLSNFRLLPKDADRVCD